MPTTYTTLQYDQGAKLRATSEQPQWYSVTFQLADGGFRLQKRRQSRHVAPCCFEPFGVRQRVMAWPVDQAR